MQKKAKVRKKKKTIHRVSTGKVFVHATFNNTIVTVTDVNGKVLCWSSPGGVGFKGSRKSTPFAASVAAKDAVKKAKIFGLKDVEVHLKGPGGGKESAVRSIRSEGMNISSIIDTTPTPHNGCRPKKRRRI
ncbi:MAG: 30S ribosomal protein S11 [Candidatus Omnitrophica bacterium]|nr:30S ribosomal protein S11 [Candidatus Omnitrophota bacterium]MDD5487373.1 30S ribosomal protein S11 [Candidatus Omnitrophota bacterium]